MNNLPPSLAAKPEIPLNEQTLEQLRLERDYWQAKVDAATGWGAGYSAACGFLSDCNRAIARRETQS